MVVLRLETKTTKNRQASGIDHLPSVFTASIYNYTLETPLHSLKTPQKQTLYMGCSDVSEFEHIYGQIFTTPSCVYDRLFTWTIMVFFNALIVWKTLIDICFSVKSSLWALTAAHTKFRRIIWSMIWSCGHRSRSPMCTVLLPHRNAGRLHYGKAESIQLCDFRVGQAATGPEALI